MNRSHMMIGLAVLAIAAFFAAGLTLITGDAGYAGLSSRFFPTVVAVGLGLCGLSLLFQGFTGGLRKYSDDVGNQKPQIRGFLWLLGGLLFQIAGIGTLGFIIASVVLFICVARGFGSKRPLFDALLGLVLISPLWFLFSQVLGLKLPLLPIAGV